MKKGAEGWPTSSVRYERRVDGVQKRMYKPSDVRGTDVERSVAEQEGRRQACAVSFVGAVKTVRSRRLGS